MMFKLVELLGRLPRLTLVALCLALLASGLTLVVVASTLPAHFNELKAQTLTQEYEEKYYEMSGEAREEKEREIVELRTSKWPIRNVGVWLCLVGATFALAVVRFRLWNICNIRNLSTPSTRFRLVGLASIAWLGLIPAFWLELYDEYAQDDLRPHNNEMGHGVFLAIGVPLLLALLLIGSIFFRYAVLRKVSLPTLLWRRDCTASRRNVVLTSIYGSMFVALSVAFAFSSVYFVWSTSSELIGAYIIVSTWAGLLNYKKSYNP